mgnify:CR=1 FL=1
MKVTYYAASSIDGYIAKEDGDISWLDALNISMKETGYDGFFASVDGIVMGRNTYDMICSFGTWPYGDKPTWICSSRPVTPMKGMNLQKEILPEETIQAAKAKGLQHVWLVGGGKLASSFIDKSLLTDITIS